jgi:hypothetical protein
VLYAGDLRVGFLTLDDPQYVTKNPWIRAVTVENLRHIFGGPYFANYSPLHLLSYMLDRTVAGPDAFGFHLSSNIWAGIVAGFVFLVALALTQRRWIAIAATVLFIVHPAHVEAIAWISSRKDLVATAFALPSFLAYLRYRQGGPSARAWYATSLALFALAAAGKMSVATFPAVLVAYDVFIEKRRLTRSLGDKAPFLLVVALMGLMVVWAQPPTGHRLNAYKIGAAFAESLWLLTGFGTYVIYRFPPLGSAVSLQVAGAIFILALFAAPLLFCRRWPTAAVLAYWVLFGLIPAQLLSFSHPVTDRYLFFPSVGAVILGASCAIAAGERMGPRGLIVAIGLLVAVGLSWTRATLAYLAEWQDLRSVWYGAIKKSPDPESYYNLGLQYQDLVGRFAKEPRGTPLPAMKARELALLVWKNDPRVTALLAEWSNGQRDGPIERQFRAHLRQLAWDAYTERLRVGGAWFPMPRVYLGRGLLLADAGDLQSARKEFLTAADEASRYPFPSERERYLVESHHALAVVASQTGDNQEALRWLRMAEEEQTRAGGNWFPDLTENRKRLEAIVGSTPRP